MVKNNGTNAIAESRDAIMAKTMVKPSWENICPDIPFMVASGTPASSNDTSTLEPFLAKSSSRDPCTAAARASSAYPLLSGEQACRQAGRSTEGRKC